MTAYGAVDSAVESIRQGASHYLTKPFKLDESSYSFWIGPSTSAAFDTRHRLYVPSLGTRRAPRIW